MATDPLFRNGASCFVALIMTASVMSGQTSVKSDTAARTITTSPTEQFSEADSLRGTYGPYRANNDLLYYHLDVRVDPERKFLSGKNTIRFRMLEDGTRIQLDLVTAFSIDKILLDGANGATTPLKFVRAAGRTVYVDFPHPAPMLPRLFGETVIER